MIEDQIRQTRCTTCDAEHPYKGAKVPPKRKKAEPVVAPPAASRVEVGIVADAPEPAPVAVAPVIVRPTPRVPPPAPPQEPVETPAAAATNGRGEPLEADTAPLAATDGDTPVDDGPVHRRLIRAVLPRPEGHVPERKMPEFTIREAAARANQRPGGARGGGGRPGGKFARPQGKAGRPGKGAHAHGHHRPGTSPRAPHAGPKHAGSDGQRARHHFGRGGKKSGR